MCLYLPIIKEHILIYISNLPMGLACIYQGSCTKKTCRYVHNVHFIVHKPWWMSVFLLYIEKDEMTRKPFEHLHTRSFFISIPFPVPILHHPEISFFGFFHPFPLAVICLAEICINVLYSASLNSWQFLRVFPLGHKHRGQVLEGWSWSVSWWVSLKERGWGSIVCLS
jgi:hypothetical protein